MPNYDFKCPNCLKTWEIFLPLARYEEPQQCFNCLAWMERIISKGHGGTHGEEAGWIRSMNLPLRNPRFDPLIETRSQYKRIMKEKGLEHEA